MHAYEAMKLFEDSILDNTKVSKLVDEASALIRKKASDGYRSVINPIPTQLGDSLTFWNAYEVLKIRGYKIEIGFSAAGSQFVEVIWSEPISIT